MTENEAETAPKMNLIDDETKQRMDEIEAENKAVKKTRIPPANQIKKDGGVTTGGQVAGQHRQPPSKESAKPIWSSSFKPLNVQQKGMLDGLSEILSESGLETSPLVKANLSADTVKALAYVDTLIQKMNKQGLVMHELEGYLSYLINGSRAIEGKGMITFSETWQAALARWKAQQNVESQQGTGTVVPQ